RGASFVHGDVRNYEDLESLSECFDALIEASAEPSVVAGTEGSPRYVLDTNLKGAMNCLEYARLRCAGFVFLSTARVYSIEPLLALPLQPAETRLDLRPEDSSVLGATRHGISESFPCDRYRSYYGASKLAAELLCQEYSWQAGFPVVIN